LQEQKIPLLAYELARGPDLRRRLTECWQAGCDEIVRLGVCVGRAIEALWARRIVHRDIKPENVVACDDGRFVLVDVGFAQHLELSTITRAGGQPGTQGYRSPEQLLGRKKLTVHADVFSLGVTLYEVATCVHPWGRDQHAMTTSRPPPILHTRGDLDMRVASLIHRMLSRRAGERPVNPGALFSQLGG
jgi:serine/threonine-protein kinase